MDVLYYLALVNARNGSTTGIKDLMEDTNTGPRHNLTDVCTEIDGDFFVLDKDEVTKAMNKLIASASSGASSTSSEPVQAADTSRVFGILQQKNPFENSCEVLLMPGLRYSM